MGYMLNEKYISAIPRAVSTGLVTVTNAHKLTVDALQEAGIDIREALPEEIPEIPEPVETEGLDDE